MVDRSRLNSSFTLDREMGLQLMHFTYLTDSILMREISPIHKGEECNHRKFRRAPVHRRLEYCLLAECSRSNGEYSGGDLKKRETSPK